MQQTKKMGWFWLVVAAVFLLTATASGEWTSKPLANLLPGGDESEEEMKLAGKIVSKDEKDEDNHIVTRAFLEQEDGTAIPLPCERKKEDQGMAKKAMGKALGGKDSCWDYMGQKVELLGNVQSIHKKGKRYLRLGKIVGINPL
jgi:hypothetical protein